MTAAASSAWDRFSSVTVRGTGSPATVACSVKLSLSMSSSTVGCGASGRIQPAGSSERCSDRKATLRSLHGNSTTGPLHRSARSCRAWRRSSPPNGDTTISSHARVRAPQCRPSETIPRTGTPRAANSRAVCSPVMLSRPTTTAGAAVALLPGRLDCLPGISLLRLEGLAGVDEVEDVIDLRDVRIDVSGPAVLAQHRQGVLHRLHRRPHRMVRQDDHREALLTQLGGRV